MDQKPLTKKDVEAIIDAKLREFKEKNLSYRSFIKMDKPRDSKSIGNLQFKKSVSGSRGANAALASLLSQLAAIGLIVDNTS